MTTRKVRLDRAALRREVAQLIRSLRERSEAEKKHEARLLALEDEQWEQGRYERGIAFGISLQCESVLRHLEELEARI